MDNTTKELCEIIARSLGTTPEALQAHIEARREQERRRVESNNARYARALRSMSDVQAMLVAQAEREGHKISHLRIDRHSGNVAVLMFKEKVWDGAKGRMGIKLLFIYPDGTRTTTMEKRISLKQSF